MLQLHGLERIPWLWIALHKQIFRWIFIVYFYLIILRCKITSDASCFGKRFLSLIPHAKYKMYFSFVFFCFHFQLKLLLLIDFCALQVSFHAIYFISEFTFFIQSIIEWSFHWEVLQDPSILSCDLISYYWIILPFVN